MTTTPDGKIRVLIVDDSALMRKMISSVLVAQNEFVIAGVASNGRTALELLESSRPDVVLLDMEMPEMDGLTMLGHLRRRSRDLPVVVFSTLTERGAKTTLDALTAGANDYVCKPRNLGGIDSSMEFIRVVLVPKMRHLHAAAQRQQQRAQAARSTVVKAVSLQPPPAPPLSTAPVGVIAIGVSVGGPQALNAVVPQLPRDIGVPLLLVQHMPAMFTRLLAERLASVSQIRVVEAQVGMVVEAGTLYLAPGDRHMTVRAASGTPSIALSSGPPENGCRPAVDPLFRSVAAVYGEHLLAVVMTGMGSDGTLGAKEVRAAGGRVWAQDQATSVAWGMAGSVVRAGLAERTFKLEELTPELVRIVKKFRIPAAAGKSQSFRP